ncbi:MAG: hypothetical protein KKC80_01280 [Candidatus Margulisbacteria bacterium]|nr:hypothetical protein [Candidatus Margulisiibacteriota bacterium]MBU1616296.1 hypothetical protein [Candidatus Margulisiibacteriota bacterium]MBU1867116.1 hypothetical protein [Candidatus Margulisiibacteriota bacterium]
MKRAFLIAIILLASFQFAFGYTPEEIKGFQTRLNSIQGEINTLKTKLASTSDTSARQDIAEDIQFYTLMSSDLERKIKESGSGAAATTTTTLAPVKKITDTDSVQIKKDKQRLAALIKEIAKLNKRFDRARSKTEQKNIAKQILGYKAESAAIKNRLYPKPKKIVVPVVSPEAETRVSRILSLEAEDFIAPPQEAAESAERQRFLHSVGLSGGFFGGSTSLLGGVRFPLKLIFGPALTTVRLGAGLAQSRDAGLRYYPVNFDLLFCFPPGWFTGTDNYIGFGLNYVAATSLGKTGTLGGELFYGVESEGFGGTVFGEIGYAILRTGFSPSHKGATVLVGLRKVLGR